MHLEGCTSLLRSAREWKTHYSSKARAMHRIFYYLWAMHISTALPAESTGTEEGEEEEKDGRMGGMRLNSNSKSSD